MLLSEVPNDTWYFEIVPFQGWIPMSYKIFGSIVSVLVAILLSMGYWQIILRREKKLFMQNKLKKWLLRHNMPIRQRQDFYLICPHDIRTPMNAIIGYTQLLENNLDNKNRHWIIFRKLKIIKLIFTFFD